MVCLHVEDDIRGVSALFLANLHTQPGVTVFVWHASLHVTSVLSRLFMGVLHPPIVQKYPPISVSEAAAPPIRMMTCKANLNSILFPNSYTHAST